MNAFARLSTEERRDYFEQTAATLGLPAASIEKDFWVCWLLRLLFELPAWRGHLTFKGGTSLSKGYGLIKRFSEDLDVVIDRDVLGFGGDQSPERAPSKKQMRKRLDALKAACVEAIHDSLLPDLTAAVRAALGPEAPAPTLDPNDSQTIFFAYPSALTPGLLYLNPQVKVELGARSDTEPTDTPRITPYVAEAFPEAFATPSFTVRAVAPQRTLLEKVCLLHEETFRPLTDKPRAARMARHYYDLWSLVTAGVGQRATADPALLDRIVGHRQVFFSYSWVDYGTMVRGQIRLLPPTDHLDDWRRDYAAMQQEMFWGDVPTFEEILDVVARFEAELNRPPAAPGVE
ncbi:MAG: nucleotidyl transferase AbiEii/AbiGii toxin family protein [Vicinamibacterales bacterium]